MQNYFLAYLRNFKFDKKPVLSKTDRKLNENEK